MTFVETPRLFLRKVTEEDFSYFRADLADKEMDRMMLRSSCETEEDIRIGFEWFLFKEERAYAIVLKETGETIGNLTVYNRVPECVANHEVVQGKNGKALSFAMLPAFRRKGYMYESVSGMIDHLFRVEKADYINCGYLSYNTPSKALQKKWALHTCSQNNSSLTGRKWNPSKISFGELEMNLKYKNLTIRDAVAADAEQLTAWWNDGTVMAHAGFPNGLGTTMEKVIAGLGSGRLILKESERLIGEACYRKVGEGIAEIGIKICETDCQNRGLGRVILSMLISWLFAQGFEKIVLDTNLTNKRAQHVYESLGFRKLRINYDSWTDQLGNKQSAVDYELTEDSFEDFRK